MIEVDHANMSIPHNQDYSRINTLGFIFQFTHRRTIYNFSNIYNYDYISPVYGNVGVVGNPADEINFSNFFIERFDLKSSLIFSSGVGKKISSFQFDLLSYGKLQLLVMP